MAADRHDILDQAVGCLLLPLLSLKALAKRLDDGLGQALACPLREISG